MNKFFVATCLLSLCGAPAFAANADHPYSNIDPRVDMGNSTGDRQVERLNRSQLDRNYQGQNESPVQNFQRPVPYDGYRPRAYPPQNSQTYYGGDNARNSWEERREERRAHHEWERRHRMHEWNHDED